MTAEKVVAEAWDHYRACDGRVNPGDMVTTPFGKFLLQRLEQAGFTVARLEQRGWYYGVTKELGNFAWGKGFPVPGLIWEPAYRKVEKA